MYSQKIHFTQSTVSKNQTDPQVRDQNQKKPQQQQKNVIKIMSKSPQPNFSDQSHQSNTKTNHDDTQIGKKIISKSPQHKIQKWCIVEESKNQCLLNVQSEFQFQQLKFDCCEKGQDQSMPFILNGCNHCYHEDCIIKVIDQQLKQSSIICLIKECKNFIKIASLQKKIANVKIKELLENYSLNQLEQFKLTQKDKLMNCLSNNCSYFIIKKENKEMIHQCPICLKIFCLNCEKELANQICCCKPKNLQKSPNKSNMIYKK